MKNIIEKDNKLWMKCPLVMLPTNKETYLVQVNPNVLRLSISIYPEQLKGFIEQGSKFQHLYILSDEEIKEDEYYLGEDNNIYCLVTTVNFNGKKIISTNNSELNDKGISEIPQSFIQEFIKDKGKGYDEILIEVVMRTFNNIVSKPQYYYEIQLSSNNEVNIIMENVDNWDLIHNRYLDYVVIHNKQVGVVNLIKWLKENYNLPTKIEK